MSAIEVHKSVEATGGARPPTKLPVEPNVSVALRLGRPAFASKNAAESSEVQPKAKEIRTTNRTA